MGEAPSSSSLWPLRPLGPTDILVGRYGWHAGLLAEHADAIAACPSLVVVSPEDDDQRVRAAGRALSNLPEHRVMLCVREPAFARRLPELIRRRIDVIDRPVEIVTLWVQDTAELKSGRNLQTLMELRQQGLLRHIGLGHEDVRSAEWLAQNSACRVLMLQYHVTDQSARYRALAAATEHGIAAVTMIPRDADDRTVRFALGESPRVLPIFQQWVPPETQSMAAEEIQQCWEAYQQSHPAPPPLPRSQPPE